MSTLLLFPPRQHTGRKLAAFALKASNWLSPSKTFATPSPTIVLQTKVEIVVTEGDQEGSKISAMVQEIGASMLVVGLHDRSFLYKLAKMAPNSIASNFNCRVLAIKQPVAFSPLASMTNSASELDSSTSMGFSQIDISGLRVPGTPPPRIPYRICPSPSAIIWRSSKSRGR